MRVLSVGSLIWRKDHEHALRAIRRAVDLGADLDLVIVGDGPDRQHLQFTIAELGLEDRVELAGRRPVAEVARMLAAADLFLHTSTSEGISNAVLEAMAAGLPVVTTDVGGMAEVVREGVDGSLVPIRAVPATGAALHRLAADPSLRAAMGREARQRVLDRFRLDQQIDAFWDLLHEAVGVAR
jgi:glycosyltransferase involved in cell wall biosynthesis